MEIGCPHPIKHKPSRWFETQFPIIVGYAGTRSYSTALSPIIFSGAGCSKPEANLVGEWQIQNGLDRTASASSIIAQQYKLIFKVNKTYTMGDFQEGTYTVDGRTVTLTVTQMNGIAVPKRTDPLNKPTDYTLSDDE